MTETVLLISTCVGLLFDLLGAFLLSIPMVWNSEDAARSTRKLAMAMIKFAKSFKRSLISLFVVAISQLLSGDIRYALPGNNLNEWLLSGFEGQDLLDGLYGLISSERWRWAISIALDTFVTTVLFLAAVFSLGVIVYCLFLFVRFLKTGNADRRIGATGLGFLGFGFIIQAGINVFDLLN